MIFSNMYLFVGIMGCSEDLFYKKRIAESTTVTVNSSNEINPPATKVPAKDRERNRERNRE